MAQEQQRPGARTNEHTGRNSQSFRGACGIISARCPACGQSRRLKSGSRQRLTEVFDFASTPLGMTAQTRELAEAPFPVRRIVARYCLSVPLAGMIAEMASVGPREARHE